MRTGNGIQWQFTLAFVSATIIALLLIATVLLTVGALLPAGPVMAALMREVVPVDASSQELAPVATLLVLVGLIAGLVASLFGYLTARNVKRQLRALNRGAIAIGLGDLGYRVPHLGNDEFGALADYFNGMAEQLEANARDLHRLAVIEERNRLASDLHDSVNQQIFTINLLAATARRLITRDPARAAEQMQQLEALARSAHSEMRTLIHALRPGALEQGGLAGALGEQLRTVTARAGVAVESDLAGGEGLRLPSEQELALLRIAQEAMGNAVKHSGAQRIRLALEQRDGDLLLTIADNGRGFDPVKLQEGGGLGLQTMRERAAAVGADFDLTTAASVGTTVAVRLPLKRAP